MKLALQDIISIIIAIIGFLGAIVPYVVKCKWFNGINFFLKKLFFWVSLILILSGLGYFVWSQLHTPSIKIEYPVEGGKVVKIENVKGSYRNILSNHLIWVIVYSYPDKVYYPHSSHANVDNKGGWSNNSTIIGSSIDSGMQFDIIVLLVDENSQQELNKYLNNTERHGLEELPTGVKLYDKVTVKRL